jgi:hypothetical protein
MWSSAACEPRCSAIHPENPQCGIEERRSVLAGAFDLAVAFEFVAAACFFFFGRANLT